MREEFMVYKCIKMMLDHEHKSVSGKDDEEEDALSLYVVWGWPLQGFQHGIYRHVTWLLVKQRVALLSIFSRDVTSRLWYGADPRLSWSVVSLVLYFLFSHSI